MTFSAGCASSSSDTCFERAVKKGAIIGVLETVLSKKLVDTDIAIRIGCEHGHHDLVELLLRKFPETLSRHNLLLGLSMASNRGHSCIVSLFIMAGADVRASNDHALRIASENGHTETVKVLMQAGAHVHAWDDQALRNACMNGHTKTVKVLLEAGADVHALHDHAMRIASEYGHTETVKVLLQTGADVHAWHDFAVRIAYANGYTETVKVLLQAGANVHCAMLMRIVTQRLSKLFLRQVQMCIHVMMKHCAGILRMVIQRL